MHKNIKKRFCHTTEGPSQYSVSCFIVRSLKVLRSQDWDMCLKLPDRPEIWYLGIIAIGNIANIEIKR